VLFVGSDFKKTNITLGWWAYQIFMSIAAKKLMIVYYTFLSLLPYGKKIQYKSILLNT